MATYVFDFCNIYIPEESTYDSDCYDIRIEPLTAAQVFEEERRELDSQFRTGYWKTAKCYIDAEEDRAKELAEWLSFIYSFAQLRDVTWITYYPYQHGYSRRGSRNPYTYELDNTNIRMITRVWSQSRDRGIGEFVDTALRTLDEASNPERSRILGSISLFLEAETGTFLMIKFLFLWILLESNANHNYDDYLQGPGTPLFSDSDITELRSAILDHLDNDWPQDQLDHIEYILQQEYLYEASSETKLKIYLEHLNIGFDMDEIVDILDLARSIRNPIVHRIDHTKLHNNRDIVIDLRKIAFYVLLRLLGVDRDLQNRMVTPMIFGPDIE